jgi:transposase
MEAYSLDLRQRIIKSWQQGQSKSAIARTFMVSLSSVKRYVQRFERQGNVLPTVQRRGHGKLNAKLGKRLARQLEVHPDFTLAQHREWWNRRHGEQLQVSESLLSRAFRRIGWTRKKKTIGAAERDEAARAAFRAMMKTLPVKDIVVLDESSTRIGMIPAYARAPRGCRAYDRAIQNYGRNVTLLASMTVDGMPAAMTLEGAVDQVAFEVFVREVLLPTLHPGQIVIMDNLSSHKTDEVLSMLTNAGCRVLFLPAYSPDLSPIEEAFSKLKAFIRRNRCQTIPALIRAIAQGLDKITINDAMDWFVHAGFCVEVLSGGKRS